ncbi:hypothetical protein QAD02_019892 [Eretmocerus hayati]|uniref:Uncharacterized protein n=1 Tax=Eretmocerus hayati TaxID=131215 RepID=A0ACC2PKH9_9HYME|nr:hypothetical protein QAD02_019892 [Eretmocerus hayati]
MSPITTAILAIAAFIGVYSVAADFSKLRQSRLIGGTISPAPFLVSLQRSRRHFCGGSMISANVVLTAAHCVDNVGVDSIRVRVGSWYVTSGGTLHNVSRKIIHEKYIQLTRVNLLNDIALLELNEPIKISGSSNPIPIYSSNKIIPEDSIATAFGWGALYSGPPDSSFRLPEVASVIKFNHTQSVKDSYQQVVEKKLIQWSVVLPRASRSVQLRTISKLECLESYRSKYLVTLENQICTAANTKKDACVDDDGGPLVVNQQLAGIISWGESCATPEYPRVYTEVAPYREWIKHHIQKLYQAKTNLR